MKYIDVNIKDKQNVYLIYEISMNSSARTVSIKNAISQECSLSLSIFNIYIEQTIGEIKQFYQRKIGIFIGVQILISSLCG